MLLLPVTKVFWIGGICSLYHFQIQCLSFCVFHDIGHYFVCLCAVCGLWLV